MSLIQEQEILKMIEEKVHKDQIKEKKLKFEEIPDMD